MHIPPDFASGWRTKLRSSFIWPHESDRTSRWNGRVGQRSKGLEDFVDRSIVTRQLPAEALLELVKALCELGVACDSLAIPNERSHNVYGYVSCPGRIQEGGRQDCAVLREGKREIPAATSAL